MFPSYLFHIDGGLAWGRWCKWNFGESNRIDRLALPSANFQAESNRIISQMAHRMAKTVNLSDLLVVTGECSDPGQSFVAEKLEQVPSLITEVDTCPLLASDGGKWISGYWSMLPEIKFIIPCGGWFDMFRGASKWGSVIIWTFDKGRHVCWRKLKQVRALSHSHTLSTRPS